MDCSENGAAAVPRYNHPRLPCDRRSLVTIPYDFEAAVWRGPLGEGKPARLTHAKYDGVFGAAVAPDARIVFTSAEAAGDPNLWIANADGSDRKPMLPPGGRNRYPAVSSRGDVAFLTTRGKNTWLAVARLDGAGTRVLAPALAWPPAFSPDGKTIFFTSAYRGIATLHRVPVDGGSPTGLTDYSVVLQAVSPDGRQIACFCQMTPDAPQELCVIPVEGGAPTKRFPVGTRSRDLTI